MVTTFFIGNGFDIGLGIKSRYTDFYERFRYVCSLPENSERYSKFCESLTQRNIVTKSNEDYRWIDFDFRGTDADYTWTDFENFMGWYAGEFDGTDKDRYIDYLNFFSKTFMSYLERRTLGLKDKFEGLPELLKKGLLTFDSGTGDGLPRFSKGFSEEMEKVRNTFFEDADRINIINFNYTEVIEELLDIVPENEKNADGDQTSHEYTGRHKIEYGGREASVEYVGHLHGSVSHDPIMGVNDEGQIRGPLRGDEEFKGYVVKTELMKVDRNVSEDVIREKIDDSNVICVYGCSLGQTDRVWWRHVLEKLASDDCCQLVIFLHDRLFDDEAAGRESDEATVRNLTECLIEAKKDETLLRLSGYMRDERCENEMNVSAMKDRIHVALNHDIFSPAYDERSKAAARPRLKIKVRGTLGREPAARSE